MNITLNALNIATKIVPKNIRVNITKKIIDNKLKKYANITIVNEDVIKKRKNKPTIYIGNHLSNVDGVILHKILEDNNIAFMAGVKLSKNPLTKLVVDTINTIQITPNSADKEALRKAVKHLKNNGSIFIFPEGTRSRTGSMIKARSGFILFYKMTKAEIVPVGLEGTEKLLPINKSNMSNESLKHADVKVVFGEPFKLPKRDGTDKNEWLETSKDISMRKITNLIDEKYHGVYKEK